MQVQRAWSQPLGALTLLVVAAPAALVDRRSARGLWLTASALGAGLAFIVVDGVLAALGESGLVPTLLGAWLAPIGFAVAGVTALLHLEG